MRSLHAAGVALSRSGRCVLVVERSRRVLSVSGIRTTSYGQQGALSPLDRLGVFLSHRRLNGEIGDVAGKRIGDFGCGFEATYARTILDRVAEVVLVDVALAPELTSHPRVRAIEGELPGALSVLGDASLDVVVCVSVIEHLWEPEVALGEFRRLLAPGGLLLVNVPSWFGKRFLELSAFRLGLSPAAEMDDHKRYYSPRELWPLLVRAGFVPHGIRCSTYKLGMNTFASCRLDGGENPSNVPRLRIHPVESA